MEYNYRPLGDRVVVEILKRNDEKTKGGLYKPSGSETTMMGKVVKLVWIIHSKWCINTNEY